MLLRDKNGLTEEEFLKAYKPGNYPHPSCTADLALFAGKIKDKSPNGLEILLIQRGNHPSLGKWALPGGFVNPDETVENAAARELLEETGVNLTVPSPLGVFSDPGRDPRGWTITSLFGALVGSKPAAKAADDAREAVWFKVSSRLSADEIAVDLNSESGISINAVCAYEKYETPFGISYRLSEKTNGGLAFDHAKLISLAVLKLYDNLRG